MASLGEEIDNRRHIFCSGKLSTQQPEHVRILPAKIQLLNFLAIVRRRAPIKASTLNKC